MTSPFFSIITPVRNRVNDGKLKRCLNSVLTQTFEDWEHIIVDDGSKPNEDVEGLVQSYEDDRLKFVRIKHSGKVIARNAGYSAMSPGSKWVANLDSDDCFDPEYLRTFHFHIVENPDVHLWICSSFIHGIGRREDKSQTVPIWSKVRQAWMPPIDKETGAHSFFKSGKIGLGQFVFSKEAFETIGLFPAWKNWYCVADGIHEWTGFVMDPPVYSAAKQWCGDPWGDDFAQILALSKHFRASVIKPALYRQYRN